MAETLKTETDISKSSTSTGYLQERRYLWTARGFAVFGAVSVCANIVLLLAVFNIVPLTRVEPFLLSFVDKSEQVIQLTPISTNMAENDIITESLVRYYILVRNSFVSDAEVMKSRWGADGPVKWMSSDASYREFSNQSFDILRNITKEGLSRTVTIYSVVRLSKDIWQAEIATTDVQANSSEPITTKWVVSMRVKYINNVRVKYSQRLKNPLGFKVQQYMIKRNV